MSIAIVMVTSLMVDRMVIVVMVLMVMMPSKWILG